MSSALSFNTSVINKVEKERNTEPLCDLGWSSLRNGWPVDNSTILPQAPIFPMALLVATEDVMNGID